MQKRSLNPLTRENAVSGMSEVLLALGDELRKANHQVGEYSMDDGTGNETKQPVLFFSGASVELSISTTVSAGGNVKVWVVNADGSGTHERSGTVTVHLNSGDHPLEIGQ